ncbi:hypothetical protein ACQJ0U_25965, partial [Klebsiella variicola subsp. variicola]
PGSYTVAEFLEKRIPAIIEGKQQFCGARNIHAAEYKTGLCTCKPSEARSGDARPVATFHQSYRFPNGKSYEPAIKEPAKEKKGYFVYK